MAARTTMVTVCGATDVGLVRDGNEDAFVVCDVAAGTPLTPTEPQSFPLLGGAGLLLVVCDGMGGAAAGEVAARLACQTVVHGLFEERAVVAGFAGAPALTSALRLANQVILDEARRHADERGMGTTCTAALVLEDRLIVGQIGDSRAYLFRAGALHRLTKDQSLLTAMLESGAISPAEVETFPHPNVILQALGVQERVDPVTTEIELDPGDTILLCSDGLHGPVPEATIAGIVRETEHLSACARKLVHAALEAGGPDNVTVILARCDRAA